jgi:FkbM family methyltransferase
MICLMYKRIIDSSIIKKLIKTISSFLLFRRVLCILAKKFINTHNSTINRIGLGIAQNISLTDVKYFYVQINNSIKIKYNFCPSSNWVLKKLFWSERHIYEKDTVDIFIPRAIKAKTILDIGANIGYYTYIAAAVNSCADIVAFEPIDPFAKMIIKNTKSNKYLNVTVLNKAISNKSGSYPFFVHKKAISRSTLLPEEHEKLNEYNKIYVDVICLDNFIVEKKIQNIDLIKIDTEGHELEALIGMTNILNRDRPEIICEILPVDDKGREEKRIQIMDILIENNYNWYWISSKGLVKEKIIKGHEPENANYFFSTEPY